MAKKLFKSLAVSTSAAILIITTGTFGVFAVTSSALYFNVSASDSGSYNSSSPSTWRDLSSANRNGTIYGTLTYDNANGALSFANNSGRSDAAGNAYVDMGSGFNNFGSGITIEFEGHFGVANQAWERVFDFGNGAGSENIWIGVFGESFAPNELGMELFNGTTGRGRCITTGGALPTDSSFHKYVVTLDGSKCRMYKDGIEIQTRVGNGWSSGNYSAAALGSNYPYLPDNVTRTQNYIGKSNWGSDASFNGAIKYVRIYTQALTASDVSSNSSTFTLNYSTTGSDSGTAPSAATGNGLMTLAGNSGNLAKANHTFVGWATSSGQSTAISGSYNLTSNSTLYPAFAPNTYNVTYDEHGGSSVADGTFTHGGSLTYPTNPTKSGYSFAGWFAAASGGTARTAASVSADNASVTLHAQWTPNTYYVTYDENGGSTVADGSYVFGNTLVYPAAPTRNGYIFAGWFAAASGGSALTASSVSAGTSDVTLHAQWTALPSQTVTWSPTNTTAQTTQSSVTPSSSAVTSGNGAISYSVVNAGATGCTIHPTTGVVSYTGVGSCLVRATAAQTSSYAEATSDVTFSITSVNPEFSLKLGLNTGAAVANSSIDYAASGLGANTSWSLILRSTPQTLASGTYSSSLLSGSAQFPAGLPAGWHSITLSGFSSTGAVVSHAVWFEVSAAGTLVQSSATEPATSVATPSTLAKTGFNVLSMISISGILVMLGTTLLVVRRNI